MRKRNVIFQSQKNIGKYKNISCYRDGIRFDSRKEANYYEQLKLEKRAKLIKDFERQVEFDLVVNDSTICRHRVDFYVTLQDGKKQVREVKSVGTMTDVWRIKHKLFEALYPEIEYKVVL